MRTLLLAAGALCGLPAAADLATDYTRPRVLRTETETSFEMETTSFELEVDGVPVDHPFGGSGGGSDGLRRVVTLDRVAEHADGRPRRVLRTFEEAESSGTASFGEQTFESESTSPLSGTTLAIEVDDDGAVDVSVEDGPEPDDDATLQGHRPTLALDALLPAGAVEEGDSWEVDADDVAHALGFDLGRALFPPPEPDDGEGRRGPRGGGLDFLRGAEWEGEATLVSVEDDWDGTPCARIEVTLSAVGDLPEEAMGGGRGRRGRALSVPRPARENAYSLEIEGSVWFSVELGRPVAAELEGEFEMEIERDMTRGDREMSMHMVREGTLEHRVEITEEDSE